MVQPTLFKLYCNEYSQEFHYYLFVVILDRCLRRFICSKQNRNLDLIMIAGINESKILTKHILYTCKCKFDGRKCNSNKWWNNDNWRCKCKKPHICKKDYIWNPCENGRHLGDSANMCDEIIQSYNEEIKTIPRNYNEKYNC